MNELPINTEMVLSQILVCKESIESIIPSAVVTEKVAQFDWTSMFSWETTMPYQTKLDFGFLELLALRAFRSRKNENAFIPASVYKRRRKPAMKSVNPSDTGSAVLKDFSMTESEGEPWFYRRTSQRRQHLNTYLVRQKGLLSPGMEELQPQQPTSS